jgi:hypothetical protein
LFCALGAYFALEFRTRPWVYRSLAVTPIVVDQYGNYYWHDLFIAALLAIVLSRCERIDGRFYRSCFYFTSRDSQR